MVKAGIKGTFTPSNYILCKHGFASKPLTCNETLSGCNETERARGQVNEMAGRQTDRQAGGRADRRADR